MLTAPSATLNLAGSGRATAIGEYWILCRQGLNSGELQEAKDRSA
jgi:hypothetical protein